MSNLIDKDALIAEIKERIETYNKGYANGGDRRADALDILLHDLDNLEVKEVEEEHYNMIDAGSYTTTTKAQKGK